LPEPRHETSVERAETQRRPVTALELSSPAFRQGERIPRKYTCEGDNVSPPLRWRGTPDGTRSLVLLCNDPDAPGGTFRHWAVYDIPADRLELQEGQGRKTPHPGPKQAINGFGKPGYGGPCPPRGDAAHHYHFRLMALSESSLPLASNVRCEEVEAAAERHVLAQTELVGLYQR
jgi:Raf kinase inhibitor-like YbhB/YbcL family protein